MAQDQARGVGFERLTRPVEEVQSTASTRRMVEAGEVEEQAVAIEMAEREGDRAVAALGVAPDPPRHALRVRTEFGNRPGRDVDGQIGLCTPRHTVGALGIRRERAVLIHQEENRRPSVVGGGPIVRDDVRPGGAGPVLGCPRGPVQQLEHR